MKSPERAVGKPRWLGRSLPSAPAFCRTQSLLEAGGLHTVCQEARCPNREECFSRGTTAFLILGDVCTRRCRFCAVKKGVPERPNPGEPERVATAAVRMALDYVVVTSVTRDDLVDGGASQFAETIRCLRTGRPSARIEVLIPDFQGDEAALRTVLAARPDVLNHNLETVTRLYQSVRPQADYGRSLELLRRSAAIAPEVALKSGLMLGLGERFDEVEAALRDLRDACCSILTLGQYLQPTRECLPVIRYIPPEEFEAWREFALGIGIRRVAAGPLVRSSYRAEELDEHWPK